MNGGVVDVGCDRGASCDHDLVVHPGPGRDGHHGHGHVARCGPDLDGNASNSEKMAVNSMMKEGNRHHQED